MGFRLRSNAKLQASSAVSAEEQVSMRMGESSWLLTVVWTPLILGHAQMSHFCLQRILDPVSTTVHLGAISKNPSTHTAWSQRSQPDAAR